MIEFTMLAELLETGSDYTRREDNVPRVDPGWNGENIESNVDRDFSILEIGVCSACNEENITRVVEK